jgi:hypothetical protein
MSWPTLHLLARSCVGDQFIADSRIKRAYQGRPLGQAQRALSPPNAASRRRTSYDYLRLPDPRIIKLDRETGYGISRWSAHHQIFNGMMPYMLIVTLCMIIMYFWPGMTLWLPNYLYNN